MTNGKINGWFKQNSWSLLATAAGIIVSFTLLSARVTANEEKLTKLEDVIVQIAILQTRQSNIESDIMEVKEDLRDIKSILNAQGN